MRTEPRTAAMFVETTRSHHSLSIFPRAITKPRMRASEASVAAHVVLVNLGVSCG